MFTWNQVQVRVLHEGKGFEADLIKLHSKIRIEMVKIYTLTDFGTFTLTEVIMCTSSDNLPHIKETIANEKRLSKVGYDCTERKTIKAKIWTNGQWKQGSDLERLLLTTGMNWNKFGVVHFPRNLISNGITCVWCRWNGWWKWRVSW